MYCDTKKNVCACRIGKRFRLIFSYFAGDHMSLSVCRCIICAKTPFFAIRSCGVPCSHTAPSRYDRQKHEERQHIRHVMQHLSHARLRKFPHVFGLFFLRQAGKTMQSGLVNRHNMRIRFTDQRAEQFLLTVVITVNRPGC